MKAKTELVDAALHLFECFFENPPPSPGSSRNWRRLQGIATRIYGRAMGLQLGDFETLL